jgi:hypothetical protein
MAGALFLLALPVGNAAAGQVPLLPASRQIQPLAIDLALKIDGTIWNGPSEFADETSGRCWKAVSSGYGHQFALETDGSLWGWGDNSWGQVGNGDPNLYVNAPTRIDPDSHWIAVAAGGLYTLALKSDGSLWAWGRNPTGELGLGADFEGTRTPTRIGADTNWAAISAGYNRSVALKSDGSLWHWGGYLFAPTRVGIENDWAQVSARYDYWLALKLDGSMWALDSFNQTMVPSSTSSNWISIATTMVFARGACGGCYSAFVDFALQDDGSLWGRASVNAAAADSLHTSFVLIGTAKDWITIIGAVYVGSAGGGRSLLDETVLLGLKRDGTLWQVKLSATGGLSVWPVSLDPDWGAPLSVPISTKFHIARQSLGADRRMRAIVGPVSSDSYSLLYRGQTVTNITVPAAMKLNPGSCANVLSLMDPTPVSSNTSVFYRARQVPIADPLDSDADGIDDVYELRHSNFLDPLDASDASQDFDGDGKSNLEEYRASTDPEIP